MKLNLFLFLLWVAPILESFAPSPEDEIIRNEFHSCFPEADSVRWQESHSGCDVLFVSKGIHCHIWYAKDGTPTTVYRYAQNNFLSPYLLLVLKKRFPEKRFPHLELFGMEETCRDAEITYRLIFQDATHWYQVDGDAYGNFHLNRRYNKTK